MIFTNTLTTDMNMKRKYFDTFQMVLPSYRLSVSIKTGEKPMLEIYFAVATLIMPILIEKKVSIFALFSILSVTTVNHSKKIFRNMNITPCHRNTYHSI